MVSRSWNKRSTDRETFVERSQPGKGICHMPSAIQCSTPMFHAPCRGRIGSVQAAARIATSGEGRPEASSWERHRVSVQAVSCHVRFPGERVACEDLYGWPTRQIRRASISTSACAPVASAYISIGPACGTCSALYHRRAHSRTHVIPCGAMPRH